MKRKKAFTCLIMLCLIGVSCISACGKDQRNTLENSQNTQVQSNQKSDETKTHSYISITYGRNNPDNFTTREMVIYTYDIDEGKLEERCVIPYDSQYACSVYSKKNNKVYYSARVEENDPSSNDGIWEYDVSTGKSKLLESENWSYNSIRLMRDDRLMVMALTMDHPILPAYFDLNTKKFTYMNEVNGEEIGLYSCGPVDAEYNSATDEIVCAYRNEKESYSEEYLSGEKKIPTYIAIASRDMVKDSNRIYSMDFDTHDQVSGVTQLSKNECLVEVFHNGGTEEKMEYRLYDVKFNGDKSEAKRIDYPYPDASDLKTIDGGKSYYLLGSNGGENGLYHYDVDSGKLTEILAGNPDEEGHVVGYSIVEEDQ